MLLLDPCLACSRLASSLSLEHGHRTEQFFAYFVGSNAGSPKASARCRLQLMAAVCHDGAEGLQICHAHAKHNALAMHGR